MSSRIFSQKIINVIAFENTGSNNDYLNVLLKIRSK